MNNKDLARAIGNIDDKFILEAAQVNSKGKQIRKKKNSAWWQNRALVSAASLLLCCGLGYAVFQTMDLGGNKNNGTATQVGNGGFTNEKQLTSPDTEKAAVVEEMDSNKQMLKATDGNPTGAEDSTSGVLSVEDLNGAGEGIMESGSLSGDLDSAGLYTAFVGYTQKAVEAGIFLEDYSVEGEKVSFFLGSENQSLTLSCKHADESLSDFLVSTEYPEQYDYTRYGEPMENTVPESEKARFFGAIFDSSEISVEVIEKRQQIIGYDEEGEVILQSDFGVVYPNLQVVEYSATGLSAEELYNMLIFEN